MQGGKRYNAGRKSIPFEEKKNGYKIYLTRQQKNYIDNYGNGKSFSEKCVNLLFNSIFDDKQDTVKFIDLFAGLGGIRIGFTQGFEELGIKTKCVFSSEIKKYAVEAYKNYFGDKNISGDITKIPAEAIPDFDFLLAGFPCQPFSSAGKGLGFLDTRGTLFFEIERILKNKIEEGHPAQGFLLENVEGLINHDDGKTLNTIISHLEKLGYTVNYNLLDSRYFGLAQSRKRVYIVGMLNSKISLDNFEKAPLNLMIS